MRLIKDVPEIEKAVEKGEMNLSQLTAASDYFKREKKDGKRVTSEAKLELLNQLKDKSSRECEKIIASKNPELAISKERERVLTHDLTEIKIIISEKLMTKIKRLKDLKSHVNPEFYYAEIFEYCVDEVLKREEKRVGAPRRALSSKEEKHSTPAPEVNSNPYSRAIQAKTKRFVFTRDRHQCTYRDPASKQPCESEYQIEIDHIVPHALGGMNNTKNLRLRCAAHNQYRNSG